MTKISKRNFVAKAVTKIAPQVIPNKKKRCQRIGRAQAIREARKEV